MLGDNIESLKKMPDNYVDSIVTDPPYGISFMSKKWDYDVPSVEFWKEVYRILKPGGHVLSFGGSRTYHRMVCNIEDAGFEIRDQIMWVYGVGFPKSLNINKQIKNNNYEICKCEEESEHNLRSLPETNISKTGSDKETEGQVLFSELYRTTLQGTFPSDIKGSEQEERKSRIEESSLEGRSDDVQEEGKLQRDSIYKSNGLDKANGSEGRIYNGAQISNGKDVKSSIEQQGSSSSHRSQPNEQSSEQFRDVANKQGSQNVGGRQICNRCKQQIIQPGLGTGLKPSNEPICLARKPISEKTIAENVLKWGTGGINIDGCRIATDDKLQKLINGGNKNIYDNSRIEPVSKGKKIEHIDSGLGRFPANIIFDEEAGKALDEQSGVSKSNCKSSIEDKEAGIFSTYDGRSVSGHKKKMMVGDYSDKGGASRFFYCPKVSKAERNMGLDGFEEKDIKNFRHNSKDENGDIWRVDENGNKTTKIDLMKSKNTHPTIKPINLMTYLIRLITPTNGIVLDPFMGSGSTGIAAQLEGFDFVGMEMDPEYMKIAEVRINNFELYKKFIK